MAHETRSPVGISLSSEEHGPADLIEIGRLAAEHGFTDLAVSDHYHPWIDEQGESPFVWAVLGGLAAAIPDVRLGTLVTCPTVRIHPAVIAQAAATTALIAGGGFFLGVGSGENLNEHILGDKWPPAPVRLAMLEEAVEVMRKLWSGDEISHAGEHYTVEDARIYSCPKEPPPVYVSAFGPKALEDAARFGDGLVTTSPDADAVKGYRDAGGKGPAIAGGKACWAADEQSARETVARLWPNTGLPGQLAQELRTPKIFEQAVEIVDPDSFLDSLPLGPDPEVHVASVRSYLDAGYDQVFMQQIGTEHEAFLRFYRDEVLPRL